MSIHVIDGRDDVEVMHLGSLIDFNAFYEDNKDDIDSTDTKKLNKLYSVTNVDKHNPTIIHSYKITRMKGKLTLKRKNKEKISLVRRVDTIENVLNQLIEHINKNYTSTNTSSAPASLTSNRIA